MMFPSPELRIFNLKSYEDGNSAATTTAAECVGAKLHIAIQVSSHGLDSMASCKEPE
jgi:hypothetical protein